MILFAFFILRNKNPFFILFLCRARLVDHHFVGPFYMFTLWFDFLSFGTLIWSMMTMNINDSCNDDTSYVDGRHMVVDRKCPTAL